MLIQITNNCDLFCKHCMNRSTPGKDMQMTESTFKNALRFGKWMGTVQWHISGGEPTSHPLFVKFMERLIELLGTMKIGIIPAIKFPNEFVFAPIACVETNGWFLHDKTLTEFIKKLAMSRRIGIIQVCSIKGLYSNYEEIQKNKAFLESIGVYVHDTGIEVMRDLGRARETYSDVNEVNGWKWNPNCINAVLCARQMDDRKEFSREMYPKCTCKPSIDWTGDVHMSESCCCPSVGNVNTDDFETIWQRMRRFDMCGGCREYRNFMESDDSAIINAKRTLGILC